MSKQESTLSPSADSLAAVPCLRDSPKNVKLSGDPWTRTVHSTRASAVPRTILAMAVAIVLIIAAATGAFYFIIVKAPTRLAHDAKEEAFDAANRLAKGFKSMFEFTPQVTVGGVIVIEQARSVVELATVQQDVDVQYHWSQTWLGSTKTMELQGIYKAKAGFDLRDPFQVSVATSQIVAHLPATKLLSLEMIGYKVLKDESGWWNEITSEDRENAITAMQGEARSKVIRSGLLTEAKAKFQEELGEVVKGQNIKTPLEIQFQDAPSSAAKLRDK